jgi:hypothetical protein
MCRDLLGAAVFPDFNAFGNAEQSVAEYSRLSGREGGFLRAAFAFR